MPPYQLRLRPILARPGKSGPARWCAAAILLFCALITPASAFAAAPVKPVAAPRAQGSTVERFVDGLLGSNTMKNADDDDIPSTCTREIIPPDPDVEGDTEDYIYHSCKTLAYAISISNSGDVIKIAGGIPNPSGGPPLLPVSYPESMVINKKITLIGGYQIGFGAQIDPPRYSSLPTTIIGAVVIQGVSSTSTPPELDENEPAMEVRMETLSVTGGGIDVASAPNLVCGFPAPYVCRWPNRTTVTLESVSVFSVVDGGGGIDLQGANNKVVINKGIIQNNTGSTGGGITARNGSILEVNAGTTVSGNSAANGGGIGASNAATITIGGGVTITANSATNGGGVYASGSVLNIGSDTFIKSNSGTSGAGVYLAGGTNSISGAEINNNTASGNGGGVFAAGTPMLENLTIQQNSAQNGAGLFISGTSGGSLNSSDVLSNTASSNGGGYYINATSAFTVSSLTVEANQATNGSGGGGYATNANNLTIQGNDFTNNCGGALTPVTGGITCTIGSNANGGGLYVFQSAATLQSNSYSLNGANQGGGLYLQNSSSALVTGNTFSKNRATRGGGLYLSGNNGARLNSPDFSENQATSQGGGLYATNNPNLTIGSASLQKNVSTGTGAGLYAINSTLVFTSAAFFATNIATNEGGGGYIDSGSLLSFESLDLQNNEGKAGGGFFTNNGRITVSGATSFIGNIARNGNGGALSLHGSGSTASSLTSFFAQSNKALNGGAFFGDGVNLTLGALNLTSNQATNGNGGGAYLSNSSVTITGQSVDVQLQGNTASQNGGGIYATATSISFNNGAQFSANKANGGNGGGIYLTTGGSNTASFGAVTFSENTASNSGGGIFASNVAVSVGANTTFQTNNALAGDGGGFSISGATLALGGVTFKSNHAFVNGGGGSYTGGNLSIFGDTSFDDNQSQTGNGGALLATNATNVLVDDALFTNNVASNDGGALHFTNSPLIVQNGATFTSNTANNGRGGAILVSGSNATLNNLVFSKNKAGNGGGALHITTGILSLQNSSFSENEGGNSSGLGGGAYLKASSATVISNTFSKNTANSGAGLYLADTPVAALTTLQFTDNSSSGPGGALYLNNSTAGINTSTLRSNQAGGEGGGIYALFSRVNVTNTLVVANKLTAVANYAAGIYVGNSVLNVTHSTIATNSHQQLQGSAHAFYVATPIAAPGGAPSQSALTLINSIVSGQAVGVNLLAGNSATFNAVLWNNDAFNWTGAGAFSVTRSRRGDPRFVGIAVNDYHLRRDSAAFDQGVGTSVSVDRDGVARSQGLAPDLGAYEFSYSAGLYLTTAIAPAFVRNGDNLLIQLRVRNQSATTANNVVLNAALPSQLPAPAISSGSCQGNFCTVNLGTLAPGADTTIDINVVVNGTALSSGLLTLLSNFTLVTSNFATTDTGATASAYLYSCSAQVNNTTYNTVQAAVDAAADGQVIRISGVCGDMHQNGGPGQLLTINKNVTLQGGWNSTFTTLDAGTFPTYLDSAALGRVVYINGNFSPTFENLIIRNGNAGALGGGPAGKDAGGGVYINGGTPTFKNVDIANNQSPDLGGGVYLASPNVINFQGGFVRNNSTNERGGGLYIDQSAPILTGVNINGNSARGGGGVYLYRSPAQFLDNAASGSTPTCRIDSNTSTVMPNYVPGPTGGGLPVLWLAPGGGGGIVLDESAAIIRGCSINGNTARVGGGAYVHNSAATLENSLFTNNRAQQPAPSAILIGPGGVRDGDGGGIVLDNQDPAAITLRGLLLGLNQGVRGSGLLTRLGRSGILTLPHFTINSNSGGSAVVALGESNLALINTIVAFNTGGAALFAQAGINSESASITADRTLFHPPTQTKTGSSGGGTVASTNEFTGDPAFKDDGYHIKRISFAYNAGSNTFNFADRDGNARPVGGAVELGADEYATAVTVRYVAIGGNGSAPCNDYRSPCPSLQTAIDASSNGDFIKMAGDPTGGSYSGVRSDSGRVHYALVNKNVTIEGGYFPRTDNNSVTEKVYTLNDWEDPHPVESPTIINVSEQGRIFFITPNTTPTFSWLTLRGGNAINQADGPPGSTGGGGGAVYVDGASPIFKNVTVRESRATYGSGFYLRNANGTYSSVSVLQNGTGANGFGGGLYIQGGQPTLQSMTIQANLAITGAGVFLDNSAAKLVQNTIQNNGNSTTLDGGGVYVVTGTATLITNTLAGNQAQRGGGVRLNNSNATLRANIINNNRAGSNPAVAGQNSGFGGGLYVAGGAPLITANSITNNQAQQPALAYGGGLYAGQTAMTLQGNTISNNQAQRGGGLYFAATSGITVQNNTISSNVAQAADEDLRPSGGGVYLAAASITFITNTLGANSAPFGAALYVEGSGQSIISQNLFSSNIAGKDGGALYLDASDAILESNTLQSNRTTGGSGGGLYARSGQAELFTNSFVNNQATLDGGAIYLSLDGTTLQGDTLQGNLAGDGAGIYIEGPPPGAAQPAPWINQVNLLANNASNHGGGFFIRNSGAQITLNQVRDNHAAVNGGGAYIQESTLAAFSSNLIAHNTAGDQGGGLYITRNSTGRYQSNAVIDNLGNQGGGIFVGGASPTFVHTTLARNGSGLVAVVQDNNPTTVILSNTIVAGNILGVQGDEGTTLALYSTLWDNNSSAELFGTGNISAVGDLHGSASFEGDGYHLKTDSAAINKGLKGDVAAGTDVDNQGRFQGDGPELGADELTAACAIIVAGAPGTVYDNLQQAIDIAPLNGELLVAGTCTGVQTRQNAPQLAFVNQSLTIRGGYANGNWDAADPATHPTVLDAQGQGRGFRITSNNVRLILTNLSVINGTALGLGGGPGNADAGGNFFVNNGQLTLNGVTSVNGRAVVGGALYIKAPIALITNSNFRGNLATLAGGAIYLDTAPTSVQVSNSTLSNNRALEGGAIYAASGTPILLGNQLVDNQSSGGSGHGGGIYLAASNAILNRNRLQSNHAGLGGGIYVSGGNPTVSNNLWVANVGINDAGALYSINAPLDLRNNTWVANSTVRAGGSALLFATPATSQVISLTNNIIVDHSFAISVAVGNQMLIRATLWNNNVTKWAGAVTEGTNNIDQAPQFVNATGGNYHLLEGSPAVDQGINAGITDDIDGQSRPARQGFDIGADEYVRPSINATLDALPNPVAAGGDQTYVLQLINNGDVDIVASVRITLPNVLSPQGSPIWENVEIARGAVWEETLVAHVAADYIGPLSAVMLATTSQGASATATATSSAAAISADILEFSGESLPNPAEPGSDVELGLRIVNHGALPVNATVHTLLPDGMSAIGPTVFSPTIAGPDGIWSTRVKLHIGQDVPTQTQAGEFNQLVTNFEVESGQGTTHTFAITTTLAHPGIEISRTPSPRPALAGRPLVYTLFVTNTGNIALPATITSTFPAQVAVEDLTFAQPLVMTLNPGQSVKTPMTTTVEAGYQGALVGGVVATTNLGVSASAQDNLNAQVESLKPTATAKGGDWFDPASWEPPVVPSSGDVVLIPEDVLLFSTQPLTIGGLVNRGTLELRTGFGSSQAMTITDRLENYGEILGRDGTGAGEAGLTLNLNTAVLYNEGTICAGDGAPDGGPGGDLIIVAGSTTNLGIFCAGNGANVNNAAAGVAGGAGGNVWLTFDPGLFTNPGQVLAGNGGNSHPDAVPPQPGGNGGNITIIASAAARLNNGDIIAGQGGQGSEGASVGALGQVVIGAPVIETEGTQFSNGTVLLFDQGNGAYNFDAIGPKLVTVSPVTGVALFAIRLFNRGARQDTFVATPLTTPAGWTVNNLPSTLSLRAFRSNLIFVVITIPTDQASASVDQLFNVVISSQHDAGNQIVVPLRIVTQDTGFHIRLPEIGK